MARLYRMNPNKEFATWKEALSSFLLEKQASGLAARTLADYEWHVKRFFRQHPEAWQDAASLERATLDYFATLAKGSAAFYNLARKYLKGFLSWCCQQGVFPRNPVTFPERRAEEVCRAAKEDDLRKLVEFLKSRQDTFCAVRDLALVYFTLDTGCRPAESLRLLPADFDLRSYEAHVPASVSKTRRGRTVVYSVQTAKQIAKLLQVRPREWGDAAPLFASENGTPMLPSSWAHRLKKYCEKLGVRVSPYSLRHACALMSLRNGATVFYVERQLGHSSVATTRKYVQLSEGDLHREISTCSPVALFSPVRQRVRKVEK